MTINNEQCTMHNAQLKDSKKNNCKLYIVNCTLKMFVLFAWFVVNINFSFAQENVSQIQIQPRFIQNLSWTASEYALRYEVEIEKEENGRYVRYLTERTEESNIHISLPYGNYRYRIIPYDLFGRPGIITEYQYLEVKPSPFRKTDLSSQSADRIINIYLGVSYLTLFNIHGKADWVEAPGQFLNGVSLRLGFVASNLSFFNIGAEIVPAYYSVDSLFNNNDIKSVLVEANLLLQKDFFNRKAAFVIRSGVGISYSLSASPLASQNETAFYANMGFSFIWLPVKHFYLEIGANYSYFFAIEYPTGRIRPFAGFGTRIGR